LNLFIFGDSIGQGIVQNTVSQRYEILKLNLQKLLGLSQSVSYTNFSMLGSTIARGLSTIEKHADKLSENDLVLLEFGGNDCNFPWKEVANAPEMEHKPKTSLESFVKTYQSAVGKIQKSGAKPILMNLPPLIAKRFLNWVSAGINAENITKFLGDAEMIYRWQELYSLAVVKLAKMLSVPLIDIRSEFLCRQDMLDLLGSDGMHPTRKGYELIAKTVYDQLAFLSPGVLSCFSG